MWLGISQLQRKTTPAYFYFSESVSGLEVGSKVEFLGVEVGRVEAVFPAPDRRHVEVRAGIYVDTLESWGISPNTNDDRQIAGQSFVSEDVRGQLVTSALTSVSFIQIDLFAASKYEVKKYTFPIPWETIHTVPSTMKSFESGLMGALDQWPKVAGRAVDVLTRIDDGLLAIDFGKINADLISMMENADDLLVKLETSPFVDGESSTIHELEATLVEVRGMIADMRGKQGAVERLVSGIVGMTGAIQADFDGSDFPAAVLSVEAAGSGLGETSQEVTQLARDMRDSLAQLDATLRAIQDIANLLARDPGALMHGKSPSPTIQPK